MRKIPILKRFRFRTWVVSFIFFLTAFIILSDANRGYTTEINLLFIAKSEKTSQQARDIASNISNFPAQLSFYDLLVKKSQGFKDIYSGMDQGEKKRSWGRKIETELVGSEDGTIINIEAHALTRSEANLYSKEIPNALFDLTSRFYNIKDDVGLVLLERPIVYTQVNSLPLILTLSSFFAIGLAYLFEVFIFSPKKLINRKNFPEIEKIKNLKNIIKPVSGTKNTLKQDFKKKVVALPEEINYDIADYQSERRAEEVEEYIDKDEENGESVEEESVGKIDDKKESLQEFREVYDKIREASYPNYPEMPERSGAGKMGGAPSNLPVGEDDAVFTQAPNKKEKIEEPKRRKEDRSEPKLGELRIKPKKEIEEKKGEPSEEEIKQRLNKLLRGEM